MEALQVNKQRTKERQEAFFLARCHKGIRETRTYRNNLGISGDILELTRNAQYSVQSNFGCPSVNL